MRAKVPAVVIGEPEIVKPVGTVIATEVTVPELADQLVIQESPVRQRVVAEETVEEFILNNMVMLERS